MWIDGARGLLLQGASDNGMRVIDELVVGDVVGAARFGADGTTVVAGNRSVAVRDQQGKWTQVAMLIPNGTPSSLNDGACDPMGRFLVGSKSLAGRQGTERLFSIDLDHTVSVLDNDLTLSNGICWSKDGRTMYSVDSVPGRVWRRPYDPVSGLVGSRELFVTIDDGLPDGACIDERGRLWLAVWGAGEVRCYDPNGECVEVVTVDAPHVTSCAFVGEDLRTLLITTASEGLGPRERALHPASGRLFTVEVGARGVPTHGHRLEVMVRRSS